VDSFFNATLTNCTVSGNSAGVRGGGLFTQYGTNTLTDCTVSCNSAAIGGGIANEATLNISSSKINNNQATFRGGGISDNTPNGKLTITDSTIAGNQVNASQTALGGGIDVEDGTLSLTNCTVKGNKANGATALGGGIYALNSTVDVEKSKIKDNEANGSALGQGGGVYSVGSTLILGSTKVKGNKASTSGDDIFVHP
jgi:Right handed beta helix region